MLAEAEGESCRANCLAWYLKSLDEINNVLRASVSHPTAHHKNISPDGNDSLIGRSTLKMLLEVRDQSLWTFKNSFAEKRP